MACSHDRLCSQVFDNHNQSSGRYDAAMLSKLSQKSMFVIFLSFNNDNEILKDWTFLLLFAVFQIYLMHCS